MSREDLTARCTIQKALNDLYDQNQQPKKLSPRQF